MTEQKYWRITAQVEKDQGKVYSIRIGSAMTLPNGQIIGRIEAQPFDWFGEFKLVPQDGNREGEV